MSWHKLSGGVRPSRPLSALGALVGIGLLITLVLFFVHPFLGAAAFIVLWVIALLGIISFHLCSALGERGIHHARFEIHPEDQDGVAEGQLGDQLRELESLRRDGLLSEDEYRHKRTEVLGSQTRTS